MTLIPSQVTLYINPALMPTLQQQCPVINFPCKAHIVRFVCALHHIDPDEVLHLDEKSLLGLTFLAQTISADQFIDQQKEHSLMIYTAYVKMRLPNPERFYLTDRAIIRLNEYLEAWFIHFVTFQVEAMRAAGMSQAHCVEQIMTQYQIDDTELSSDAIKKISYRQRMRQGGRVFTRGQLKK